MARPPRPAQSAMYSPFAKGGVTQLLLTALAYRQETARRDSFRMAKLIIQIPCLRCATDMPTEPGCDQATAGGTLIEAFGAAPNGPRQGRAV